jgi:glucan 1,3-beta-glucosidase
MGFSKLFTASLLALGLLSPAIAVPTTNSLETRQAASSYWMSSIERQGVAVFGGDGYKVFRNVKDYGAVGDGVTDDTAAINKAVQDGDRCIENCDSKTSTPALVFFPSGTYLVSTPIIQTYYTQFVGDATAPPTLKASAGFTGMAVIDSDPYENGANWYVNQNNFFRQVRNFVIDITAMPSSTGACIHWQVAQATSLQNIVFNMNTDTSSANAQKGIFMDNGSGGFMADLTFNGGGFGAWIGNQQFTTRNMTFNNCNTAIFVNWCWLWTMQGITINNAQIGIDMSSGGVGNIQVGSFLLLDSKISGTPVGINTLYQTDLTMTNNTLILDNVDMSDGVTTAIRYAADNSTLLAGGQMITSFAQGRTYNGDTGVAIQALNNGVTKPAGLLSNGKVFTRTKPQYEDLPASSFVSMKTAGAKGDGVTDDTAAIQDIFDKATTGQVMYFDHGAYIISDTIKVPKDIKITGEMWPLLMATGSKFSDQANPIPVFQVGEPGDVGDVEMSDLVIETKGPVPGAILMQWNLAGSSAGAAGLWDVHFRVGGTAGTDLQSDKCAKNPNATHGPSDECMGSFLSFHATKTASVYVENCWFWTADHELDLTDHSQIDIYNGRGVLIESTNPTWFWGTASEHSQMYNYQLSNAQNVWMSVIQTETAYMQGNPDATVPFTVNEGFNDPDFTTSCAGGSASCARTWGLRVTNSSDVFVFGGGLYSFFDNYDQDCLATESCQENIISIESSSVHLFGISTKASVNMISLDGQSMALDKDNRNTFCAAIAKFESNGGPVGT